MSNYNGWANWETWNVALWIGKEEHICRIARLCTSYHDFNKVIEDVSEGSALAYQTPDGVAWNDSALDTDALDIMISEL